MTSRRRIIYVPGKNRKPEPAIHRRQLWRCLLNGVSRVDQTLSERMETDPDCFEMAAWNHTYYGEHVSLEQDIPWIDRAIKRNGASREDIEQASAWSRIATQLMYELGDLFHGLIGWLPDERIRAMVRDTAPYFGNLNGVAEQIRGPVKQQISEACKDGDRVLLIGHSLGSVIAYDALWQLTHVDRSPCSVDLFLTIGSPLGMRYVQKHLLGRTNGDRTYPSGIHSWENVSAAGDLISLDKTVREDFGQMVDGGLADSIHDHCGRVFNWFRNDEGLNVHRSYGYLVNPVVGRIVTDWWQDISRDSSPVMVAHRGYPSVYPENTLISFSRALEAGTRFVELDVQLSKDQVPVLYHDADTKRISGVEGSLFELTIEEIKKLDAHVPGKFGDSFRGNRVSTLAEFSKFFQGWPGAQAFVEIKADSVEHFGMETTVDQVVDAIGSAAGRCTIISFHGGCIEYARTEHGMRIGWVLSKWNRASEARARSLAPEFIFVNKKLLPAGACAVWSGPWRWAVYVVDDVSEANGYPARGISHVETDRIGEVMADPALRKIDGSHTIGAHAGR
jgi:glycerophosphoryl diester phosphodiesterase